LTGELRTASWAEIHRRQLPKGKNQDGGRQKLRVSVVLDARDVRDGDSVRGAGNDHRVGVLGRERIAEELFSRVDPVVFDLDVIGRGVDMPWLHARDHGRTQTLAFEREKLSQLMTCFFQLAQ
jgi:hypothetical protein